MTIHRFFVTPIQFTGDAITLLGDTAWQISKVLRLMAGDIICIFDGSGKEYRIMLERVDKKEVTGHKVFEFVNNTEPTVHLTLYHGLLPRDTFEHVLQKGTEVGVSAFVPVEAERSIVRIKDIKEEKLTRWKKIVQEAAEQSERGNVPTVSAPVTFQDAITHALNQGSVLIAWENEEAQFLSQVIGNLSKDTPISLFVGPEGGFSQDEMEFAKEKGAITVSLGPRILKSETAGPVFAALVLYDFEDLSRKREISSRSS